MYTVGWQPVRREEVPNPQPKPHPKPKLNLNISHKHEPTVSLITNCISSQYMRHSVGHM